MKYEPESTIDLLINNFRNAIDPNKIISAIMNTDIAKREKVVGYLKILINETKVKDKNVHNLYIFFLSQIGTERSIKDVIYYLQNFLDDKNQKDNVFFEVEYALKVFSQFKIFPAQALTLAIMGKYNEAIRVALDNNYVGIAKIIAGKIEDPKIKKNIWLEIFINEISKNSDNFNVALTSMNQSGVLKIEDVLPYIMGNIKIEVFKKEITNCINIYENDIQELKKNIHNYNTTAENIKVDINKVKKKHMEVKYNQCICEICTMSIKDDNLFIFPCGHIFDSACIIESLSKYSSFITSLQPKMDKLSTMKNEMEVLERRRMASRLSVDENGDRGTFFSNFNFNFGFTGQNSGNQPRSGNLSISSEEITKLNEMKVYNF
jgi:hypothetical protein